VESLCRPPRQARQLSTINQTTAKQTNGVFSEDQRANLVAGRDLLEIGPSALTKTDPLLLG